MNSKLSLLISALKGISKETEVLCGAAKMFVPSLNLPTAIFIESLLKINDFFSMYNINVNTYTLHIFFSIAEQ